MPLLRAWAVLLMESSICGYARKALLIPGTAQDPLMKQLQSPQEHHEGCFTSIIFTLYMRTRVFLASKSSELLGFLTGII